MAPRSIRIRMTRRIVPMSVGRAMLMPCPAPPRSWMRRPRERARALFLERELLNAPPGRRFADVEIALVVDAHPVRTQHLSGLAPAAPELTDDLEIRAPQDPDLVIRAIGDIQPLLLRVG